jgi:hypothetical protein
MPNKWIPEGLVLLSGPAKELRLIRNEDDDEYYWKK